MMNNRMLTADDCRSVLVVAITPRLPDRSVDLVGVRGNVRHLVDRGVDFLMPECGTGLVYDAELGEYEAVVTAFMDEAGGDALGAWMTSHPAVRKISFTGSVATGKLVAAAAAPDLKRITLELGGNDPAIVLPDVDVARTAKRLFWGAFENCGQVCSAIKRVYVPESLYESMVAQLADMARGVKVGNGLDEDSQLGPINNRPQFERVQELVEDARQAGARLVTGGQCLGEGGYFYAPTIVADLQDGVRLVDEEQFGPVLPVVPYTELDDAIERANATHFGLSGSVWSSDTARAEEVARRLECGTAWVNQHLNVLPHAPFGGAKWSGIGVENGPWGLLGFTEIQTVNVAKG